jgi:hypothetical protein
MHRFKLIVIASALLFTVGPVSAQEKQAPPPVQQPTPQRSKTRSDLYPISTERRENPHLCR